MGSHLPFYTASALPGKKEGVTGTVPAAFSVSINRYIADHEERRKGALNVINFLTSKETQKEYILKKNALSAMKNLYYDKEICDNFECDVFLNSRPFAKFEMNYEEFGYEKFWYLNKVRSFVFDYVYGEKTLDEAMKGIIDLTKVYSFSIGIDDSKVGLAFFIIYIVLISIMVISVGILSVISRNRRSFLPFDFWLISIFGTIVIMSSIVSVFGSLTSFKCQLRISLPSIGFTVSLIPILCKLIVNFPTHNKVSTWFDIPKNRHLFFIASVLIEILFNSLLFASPYTIDNEIIDGELIFQTCSMNRGFGKFLIILILLLKEIILLSIMFLVFIEWNYRETVTEVKVLALLIFIEVFSIIIIVVYNTLTFKNYITYGLLFCCIALPFPFSSFLCILVLKLIPMFKYDTEEEVESVDNMMKKMHENKGVFLSKTVLKSSAVLNNNENASKDNINNNNNSHNSTEINCVSPIKTDSTRSLNDSTVNQINKSQGSVLTNTTNTNRNKNNIPTFNKLLRYHYKKSKD